MFALRLHCIFFEKLSEALTCPVIFYVVVCTLIEVDCSVHTRQPAKLIIKHVIISMRQKLSGVYFAIAWYLLKQYVIQEYENELSLLI